MAVENTVPVLNRTELIKWGTEQLSMFERYKKDRRSVEETWLESLRQIRGKYDPKIESLIPEGRSRAYPKITRYYVIGMVARFMSLLFPGSGDRNWSITPSPIPHLDVAVANQAIDAYYATLDVGVSPSPDEIKKVIADEAVKRASRMQVRMDDQLKEMDYISLARKVVFSAIVYGAGVLKGPLTRRAKRTDIRLDQATSRYRAFEIEAQVPFFEFLPIWSYYPDLVAKEHTPQQMDGHFERHILTAAGVRELAEQPGYSVFSDEIDRFLRDNPYGNYKEEHWEQSIRAIGKSDRENVSLMTNTKYELHVFWGQVSGHRLAAGGVDIPESGLDKMYEGSVAGIGNTIIKAELSPLHSERVKRRIRPAHAFVFEEDEISLLGSGLPPTVRDSQLVIGDATRMMLDNASVVCGPNLVVDRSILLDSQDLSVHAFKVWEVDASKVTTPGQRPVYEVKFDSHLNELQAIIRLFMEFSEKEISFPSSLLGDFSNQNSEPFRTASGASALLSVQALPIRDSVRNYDRFTESVMYSLYYWNMEFGTDPDEKGDYTILTHGSTTLISREVRAASLDQLAQTMTDDEKLHVDMRKFARERLLARDAVQDILVSEEESKRREQQREQQLATEAEGARRLEEATVKEVLSKALKNIRLGEKATTDANVKGFEAMVSGLIEALSGAEGNAANTDSARPSASKPSKAISGKTAR